MLGVYGIYTPISSQVGVSRGLVMNPRYHSTRGYLKDMDLKTARADNLFTAAELLNVFTPKHADSPRAIMASVQGRHLTPTKVQDPYLVGSGVDKALPHMVGQDFAFKATDDGTVIKIDQKKELAILQYKNGEKAAIDFSPKPAKNSGGGFFIQNKLDLNAEVKVGYKFKKGDILAKDDNFFKDMLDGSTGFAAGRLSKLAVLALPETFEDSCVITQQVVSDMSSDIINEREVVLKKNSRIISVANVGDEVEVDTPLVVFEEVGSDETLAVAALEKLDAQTKGTISELARSTAKSKFAGKIFAIRIYYNAELDEMHPTLKNIVEQYKDKYDSKAKIIQTLKKDEIIQQPSTEKHNGEKLLGNDVDGVVIKFFIMHDDKMAIGSKVTAFTSLKCIIAETIPEGKEPYTEYNKDEELSMFLSPLSIVSRMTTDFYLLGFSNKVIIELENQVLDLLEE